MHSKVAILWDIENVTPSAQTMFLDGLWEYAESLGKVIVSFAYADWGKPGFKSLGPDLAQRHFTMLHVPYRNKRQNKNGSDMHLVADALDLLRFYPHIDTYLLLSGDSDFRPLLLTLRRSGKKIHLLCDIKTASQDLLMLADSFNDYREVIPNNDEIDEESQGDEPAAALHTIQYWFERLAETASILVEEKSPSNIGSLKVRIKMLNPEFDVSNYGYRSWSSFVAAAVRQNYLTVKEEDSEIIMAPSSAYLHKQTDNDLNTAFHFLTEELQNLSASNNGRPFHNYSVLSQKLHQRGLNLRKLGFNQFKKFIAAAELRGIVETKVENFMNFVALVRK